MEDLRAVAQRLGEARRAHRHDHEFLDVDAVVGMRAAVDDVHHRHRHGEIAAGVQVAEQRLAAGRGRSFGCRHGNREDGVGAEAALVLGAVELDEAPVQRDLLGGVHAFDGGADLAVDVRHGLQHALAQVTRLVAVTQLDGLARAGGRAGRHAGAAHETALQHHVRLDGGVAARIQDLARAHFYDLRHLLFSATASRRRAAP